MRCNGNRSGGILTTCPLVFGSESRTPSPTLTLGWPKAGKRGQGAHSLLPAAFSLSGPPKPLPVRDRLGTPKCFSLTDLGLRAHAALTSICMRYVDTSHRCCCCARRQAAELQQALDNVKDVIYFLIFFCIFQNTYLHPFDLSGRFIARHSRVKKQDFETRQPSVT